MKTFWRIIASFFGIGYFPLAPGTLASLAVLLLYKLLLGHLPWPFLAVMLVLLIAVGTRACHIYAADLGKEDPRSAVIDEAAGQLLVFINLSPTWLNLWLAFALFRFFDIVKPFPVSRAEKLAGGWGIMADDVVAAVAAKIVLHLYLLLK